MVISSRFICVVRPSQLESYFRHSIDSPCFRRRLLVSHWGLSRNAGGDSSAKAAEFAIKAVATPIHTKSTKVTHAAAIAYSCLVSTPAIAAAIQLSVFGKSS